MITHNLIQGSAEWHAYRANHFNASDAPAMLGLSPYTTRTQLLDRCKTGITEYVDAATQERFDDGHRFEALARPMAEKIIGEELSPVVGSEGKLSASYDGLTFMSDVASEHKLLGARLADLSWTDNAEDFLQEDYLAQMEQQLHVSGAMKCLFMATKWKKTDDVTENFITLEDGSVQYYKLIESRHCWYHPNMERRQRIINGWAQFEKDLATHEPRIIKEAPKAEPVEAFPVPSVQVKGELVACNLADITPRFDHFLETTNTDLKTDDDFAQGEADAKASREAAKNLKLKAKEVVDQIAPVSDVVRTLEAYAAKFDALGLKLEKAVKDQKEAIKSKIASDARMAYLAHVKALSDELSPIMLTTGIPDFGGAMKNKRTIASLHDAVDTLLAQSKIEADALALDIRTKLNWYHGSNEQWGQLFTDLQAIIYKPFDDFKLLVETRVDQEKKRRNDERERQAAARIEAERIASEKKPEPVSQPVAQVTGIQRDPVIEHQDDISAFMKSRDFGKDAHRIRAVLVEFVKFQEGYRMKAAA